MMHLPRTMNTLSHPEYATDGHAGKKANQISQQQLSEEIAFPLRRMKLEEFWWSGSPRLGAAGCREKKREK